jgi:hypothetical protein
MTKAKKASLCTIKEVKASNFFGLREEESKREREAENRNMGGIEMFKE